MKSNIFQEIRNIFSHKDYRLVIAVVIIAAVLSIFTGALHYKNQLMELEKDKAMFQQELESQPSWRMLSNYGLYLIRPISPLSIFSKGVDDNIGRLISLERKTDPYYVAKKGEHNLFSSLFGTFDLTFVVVNIFSLVAIFLTYNLTDSKNTVQKLFARFAILAVPLIAVSLIGLVVSHLMSKEQLLILKTWKAFSAVIFVYLLYIIFYICMGALGAKISKNPSFNLIVLLLLWVFLNSVVPAIGYAVSEQTSPVFYSELYFNQRSTRRNMVHAANKKSFDYYDKFQRGESVDKLTEWTNKESDKLFDMLYTNDFQMNEEYKNKTENQNKTAEIIAVLSPSYSLEYAAAALAGSGPYSAEKFKKVAEAYDPVFFNYVLSHFEPESYRYQYPYPLKLEGTPKFEFKTSDLYPPVSEIMKYLLALLGMCILLLFLLFIDRRSFLKE